MNVKLKIFCGFLSGVIIGFIFSPVKHGVMSEFVIMVIMIEVKDNVISSY